MRPPIVRPSTARSQSGMPPRSGAASPAESMVSVATTQGGTKRKERDFDNDGEEETNINVVVRCRGRNEREVRENSGVVLSTDGVRGKSLELSMGPSALSNKTYHFDKVFSSAADQSMIYDEVVTPILDEVTCPFTKHITMANVYRCLLDTTARFLPMDKRGRERHTRCPVI